MTFKEFTKLMLSNSDVKYCFNNNRERFSFECKFCIGRTSYIDIYEERIISAYYPETTPLKDYLYSADIGYQNLNLTLQTAQQINGKILLSKLLNYMLWK